MQLGRLFLLYLQNALAIHSFLLISTHLLAEELLFKASGTLLMAVSSTAVDRQYLPENIHKRSLPAAALSIAEGVSDDLSDRQWNDEMNNAVEQ